MAIKKKEKKWHLFDYIDFKYQAPKGNKLLEVKVVKKGKKYAVYIREK